jgi:hypothetical protein
VVFSDALVLYHPVSLYGVARDSFTVLVLSNAVEVEASPFLTWVFFALFSQQQTALISSHLRIAGDKECRLCSRDPRRGRYLMTCTLLETLGANRMLFPAIRGVEMSLRADLSVMAGGSFWLAGIAGIQQISLSPIGFNIDALLSSMRHQHFVFKPRHARVSVAHSFAGRFSSPHIVALVSFYRSLYSRAPGYYCSTNDL